MQYLAHGRVGCGEGGCEGTWPPISEISILRPVLIIAHPIGRIKSYNSSRQIRHSVIWERRKRIYYDFGWSLYFQMHCKTRLDRLTRSSQSHYPQNVAPHSGWEVAQEHHRHRKCWVAVVCHKKHNSRASAGNPLTFIIPSTMSTAPTLASAPQVDLLTTQQNFYDPILHCSPPAFNTGMSSNFYGVRIGS